MLKDLRSFLIHFGKHFIKSDCSNRAEALTFSSLLSFVPLLTIFFGVLTFFQSFNAFSTSIENFIFTHFLPSTGDVIQDYFQRFIHNAFKLSGLSLIFLLFVSIKMVFNVENALDVIWKPLKKRSIFRGVIAYTLAIILFPLLVGTGFAVRAYLGSFAFFSYAENALWLKNLILIFFPFFSSFLVFFIFYFFIPSVKVKLKSAVYGGLVATLLFQSLEKIFGWYIKSFTSYEILYGALSVIPVFLIWIYCFWIIVLGGAVFTYVLQYGKRK